jgi:tRNA A-37 threonylcarbamoyl transferase component Bud32
VDSIEVVLQVLAAAPQLGDDDVQAAAHWWQQERRGNEGFAEFLMRQQILLPDAPKALDLIAKGALTYFDPKRIVSGYAQRRLQDYAQRAGLPYRPAIQLTGGFGSATAGPATPGAPSGQAAGGVGETEAAPPPGARIDEVRAWLARQAEARQAKAESGVFSLLAAAPPPAPPAAPPAAPSVAPAASAAPGSKFLRGVDPSPPSASGVLRSGADAPRAAAPRPAASLGARRAPEPGMEIGKFLLVEQIGQGGSAIVFRALHRVLNIPVALKFLRLDQTDVLAGDVDDAVFQQLRKEAQLLARFNHPNIVRVFDFEENDDLQFLVMEFVDGLSLGDMLNHCGRLRPDCAARIVYQIADGLASAQKKTGLVHRDVKPGNILLARDGAIKLADLGLAVTHDLNRPSAAEGSTILAGTVAYMSPEQALPQPAVDHRSDIYSLGATFYNALTGEMPFKGKSRIELVYKHAKEPPPPPHLAVAGLDPLYSEITLKMLAKDPGERYQSYDDLLAALAVLQTAGEPFIGHASSTQRHQALNVATTPD